MALWAAIPRQIQRRSRAAPARRAALALGAGGARPGSKVSELPTVVSGGMCLKSYRDSNYGLGYIA